MIRLCDGYSIPYFHWNCKTFSEKKQKSALRSKSAKRFFVFVCMNFTVRIRSAPDRCNLEFRDRPRQPAEHSQTREGKQAHWLCRVRSETLFSLPKPVCTLNARQCFRSFLSVCLIIAYFRPLVKRFCKLFPISAYLLLFIRHYLPFSYQFRKNIEKVRIIR